jgi:hypothetical protein
MASPASLDIVNALFAGQKDLSDLVNVAMHDKALEAIQQKKHEVGKQFFNSSEEEEEEDGEEQPSEENDETDHGED